jgi:hypothetical protein
MTAFGYSFDKGDEASPVPIIHHRASLPRASARLSWRRRLESSLVVGAWTMPNPEITCFSAAGCCLDKKKVTSCRHCRNRSASVRSEGRMIRTMGCSILPPRALLVLLHRSLVDAEYSSKMSVLLAVFSSRSQPPVLWNLGEVLLTAQSRQ